MTELQTIDPDAGTIEVLPPRQAAAVGAQQMLRAHAQMMDDAYQLACKMVATTMVPTRFFRKEEDATAAILYGAELGLNPIQSLQRVIPIHGMPSIEGRTMVALLQSRGYKFRWVEKSNERCVFEGWDPKDPDSVANPERSEWDIARATLAEYVPEKDQSTGKWRTNSKGNLLGNMKYITDPQAMLKAKCQAEVCRDLAPDVLLGISYATEELESENWDSRVVAERGPATSAPITAEEILGEAEAPRAKRERPSGARRQKRDEPVDAEVAAEPAAEPAPAAAAEPEAPAAAPAADVEPEPADVQPDPERDGHIRKLFALLGKAGLSERDDRLVIYRKALQRPEIGSTNDLSSADLEYVIGGLEAHDKKGDLTTWAEGVIDAAALAEIDAARDAEEANTTTEGE